MYDHARYSSGQKIKMARNVPVALFQRFPSNTVWLYGHIMGTEWERLIDHYCASAVSTSFAEYVYTYEVKRMLRCKCSERATEVQDRNNYQYAGGC